MRLGSLLTTCFCLARLATNAVAGEGEVRCPLVPIHAGVCQLGKDHVLGDRYSADERLKFAIYAFLVEGPRGEKALIDLGPKTLEYTNGMFRRYGFFRDLGPDAPPGKRYPDDIVQPEGNVFQQLSRLGVAPDEIQHIVFTHLHADHHGMDDAKNGGAAEDFKNALLHVSAIGWNQNLKKRKDGQWGSYVDYAFSDFLVRREKEGKVRFEDNVEIFPGLRTLHLGGHSICSQAVIVQTAEGPAIITSDEVYLYDLLERGVLPRIRTSVEKYRQAVDRLVALATRTKGILLPIHEPLLWEKYSKAGENWLRELRPLSERATRGYVQVRGKR